jgi:hypothetical protein
MTNEMEHVNRQIVSFIYDIVNRIKKADTERPNFATFDHRKLVLVKRTPEQKCKFENFKQRMVAVGKNCKTEYTR